jgi:hypothetical protein
MLSLLSPSDSRGSGKNPLPQCAFEMSMFNVSAIHINSRSWLRSSSTHEPSDPPLRMETFALFKARNVFIVIGRNSGDYSGEEKLSPGERPYQKAIWVWFGPRNTSRCPQE